MHHYIGAEVPGGLAASNTFTRDESGRRVITGTLAFEFLGWMGDDLVTTAGYWLVSGRLAEALRASDLTGYELTEVETSTSPEFRLGVVDTDFPDDWERFVPTGTEGGEEDFQLGAGRDLLANDAALALLRQFNLNEADIGDDTAPVIDPRVKRFLDGDARAKREPKTEAEPKPKTSKPAPKPVTAASDRGAVSLGELQPINGITGEILIALAALGAPEGDPRVKHALELTSGPVKTETFQDPDKGPITTLLDGPGGFDLRFNGGSVSQVSFHFTANRYHATYPRPQDLIVGLDLPTASREAVDEALGTPYRTLASLVSRYELGNGFIHIGWGPTGQLTLVVLRDK